ncbi:MAG TPA: right-handed parallel beta-helix repeat-containing protein, partial [Bacillota bacterium]|nr:right-handed parallel beta-helix repeat-containing protein [Bacillota bacterium]
LFAKVTVNYFAKATPDNQEGFGIMARDAIGNNLDSTIFASNMAMVGGYRGLVQSVFRNKVADPSGAGALMEGVYNFGPRPANDGTASYLLRLRKTNTGYHASVNGSPEKIYYRPHQLEILNPQIYVGFFAARVASITVSDIVFTTTNCIDDPPGEEDPDAAIKPSISVQSPSTASAASYSLNVTANVKGNLEIRQNGVFISNDPITNTEDFTKNTTLTYGENVFDLTFFPDPTQKITSADPVYFQHKVTYKTYGEPGGTIYVAPDGKSTSLGTKKDPIDIYSAVQFLQAGQTAYINEGNYLLTTPLMIEKGNDGALGAPKVLMASKKRPVFDFGKVSNGLIVAGNYWEIHGIDITHTASHGCLVSGNHNLIEQVNTYANGNTGLQISGATTDKPSKWPTYNLILNCTSYDNMDAAQNNADGFAAKLQVGVGNVFRGCISHNNCDDGYDLYAKLETGAIGAVTLENCIAYGNGTLTNGYQTQGDGNGFKLGGEGLAVKHVLRNSLAFNNASTGVTSNSDPAIIVENTTSADNGSANFSFNYYSISTPQFIAKNNISFRTVAGPADSIPAGLASSDNYFYNGLESVNSIGQPVLASYFKSVTPAAFDRKESGDVAQNHYMELMPNSPVSGGFEIKDFSKDPKPNQK